MKSEIQVQAAIRTLVWVAALFYGGLSAAVQGAAAPVVPSSLPFAATVAGASSATNTSYIIAANDLLRFEVYKEPDLTTETRVDQDGTVSLPLVKLVRVAGSSISEARESVRQLYERDFLVAAHVNIVLVQTSKTNKEPVLVKPKQKFTILGFVKKPGNFEIQEGDKLNIVQAIAMAEGFAAVAKKNKVIVIRQSEGKTEKFTVDVEAMMNDSKAKPFEIKHGDLIDVPQTVF